MSKKDIENHYYKAYQLGINEVERLARRILREHPNLKEFVMAMGTYFFNDKNGNIVDTLTQKMNKSYQYYYEDTYKYFQPLNSFIAEWDEYLKLTGHAMRFTKDSQVRTDW